MARRTRYITTTVEDSVRESLKFIGDLILGIYRDKVPVDTGALRRSLSYRILVNRGAYQLQLGYLFYGAFQDLGVRGTAGIPQSANESPFKFRTRRFGLRPQNWTQLDETDLEQINADVQFLFGQNLDELFGVIFETLETTSAGTQPRTT
jgi:hypothetical protein